MLINCSPKHYRFLQNLMLFLSIIFIITLFLTLGLVKSLFDYEKYLQMPLFYQLAADKTNEKAENVSHIPMKYYERWSQWKKHKLFQKDDPTLDHYKLELTNPLLMEFSNQYWQTLRKDDSDNVFYFMSAFYDKRENHSPVVRIIGSVHINSLFTSGQSSPSDLNADHSLMCLLWFHKRQYPIKNNVRIRILWEWNIRPNNYYTVMLTCPVVKGLSTSIPKVISIVNNRTNPIGNKLTNLIRIIDTRRISERKTENMSYISRIIDSIYRLLNDDYYQPKVGVCVKAFRFGAVNLSNRLIEWLELVRLFQFDKVHFYIYGITEEMLKVLNYYRTKYDFVDYRFTTLPGGQPNTDALYNKYYNTIAYDFWPQELYEQNDCYYRHMGEYDYIAIFDIDEMMLFPRADSFKQMISFKENDEALRKLTFRLRHAYFYNNFVLNKHPESNRTISRNLHMMRHVYRSHFFPQEYNSKTIISTRNVEALFNHGPLWCLNNSACTVLAMPTSEAFLAHYRKDRGPNCIGCNGTIIVDRTIHRYFSRILQLFADSVESIF